MSLLTQINKEIYDFENQFITVVPGFKFNQNDTIEQIYRYYNSRFETGATDDEGDHKYFFNIVKNPCKVHTKAIDFDTKHINILTAPGGDVYKTWYFERDLKFWMKSKNFGQVLNRIFTELPIFGSVVLKVIKGVPYFVDLRNFFVFQSADSLDNAGFITEIHRYTPETYRKAAAEFSWKDTNKVIAEFHKMKDKNWIEVYERYGEVMKEDAHGNKTYPYKRVFVVDVGVDEFDHQQRTTLPHSGIVVKEDEVDSHPYWEFHLEKLPGRWLGIGVVETLFENQMRENEIANLQSKGSYWAAMRLFQTRDQGINRNLMIDAQNGEIIEVESEITQIDMADRNLAFFNEETRKWLENRDELTFGYDVIQGERLPAGTPLGSARLAAAMAGSHFDQIRENIALRIKELLYKVIIPQFQKENSMEHMLRLAGEDLDTARETIINQKVNNSLMRFVADKKRLPTEKHFQAMKIGITEVVNRGKEILKKIPKEFYKDIKYYIEIVITGESKDTSVFQQTMIAGLQAVQQDPTLLTDPVKKKFFFKFLEAGGVNPVDFIADIKTPQQQIEAQVPAKGGGISRPAPVTGQGAVPQTL